MAEEGEFVAQEQPNVNEQLATIMAQMLEMAERTGVLERENATFKEENAAFRSENATIKSQMESLKATMTTPGVAQSRYRVPITPMASLDLTPIRTETQVSDQ